jgi:hypothetical protein
VRSNPDLVAKPSTLLAVAISYSNADDFTEMPPSAPKTAKKSSLNPNWPQYACFGTIVVTLVAALMRYFVIGTCSLLGRLREGQVGQVDVNTILPV